MTFEEYYSPNKWLPFGAALGVHVFLLMWDPTILKASAYKFTAPLINVKMMDHLPVLEPVKPKVMPEPAVDKRRKAKKSGLSMKAKAHPAAPLHDRVAPKPAAAPKPFVSKITMPKYVPTETDESIAASPLPGVAPAGRQRASRASGPAMKLSGKSRGVRADDIHFQLSDRGTAAASGSAIVAIPIGQERGETVALPSGPAIHEAPAGVKTPGISYRPGPATGELSGKEKSGFHGIVKAETVVEGSLEGGAAGARSGRVVAGKGFEIGGPVGDRKILQRQLPEYPAWAEEKGLTAIVKVYFTVKPDGSLRSNLRILSSSGSSELDSLAKEALLQWRFSPTSDDSSVESAWGVITFHFTLS
jgi:TonB family protein